MKLQLTMMMMEMMTHLLFVAWQKNVHINLVTASVGVLLVDRVANKQAKLINASQGDDATIRVSLMLNCCACGCKEHAADLQHMAARRPRLRDQECGVAGTHTHTPG